MCLPCSFCSDFLVDSASAITLRREVLEVVEHKFLNSHGQDDLQWPQITSNGSVLPNIKPKHKSNFRFELNSDEEGDDEVLKERSMKDYWDCVKQKYAASSCDTPSLSQSQADALPANWITISINVTEDRNTMFVCRQEPHKDPLVVCIPLKDRRESDEEEQLTFDNAIYELNEIIRLSDEGTQQAVNVRNDREARAAWWANRAALDQRLRELLENVEFCWLGAFKVRFCFLIDMA